MPKAGLNLKRAKRARTPEQELEEAVRVMGTPEGYAELKLGLKLHPKQSLVLRDLFSKLGTRVSFRCANEVGKTTHVAAPAICYALDVLNAQAISTAGVWMQVKNQLVPALKKFSHLYPNWRFLETAISIGGIDRYVGFSTRDEGFAQGFHRAPGRPLLAIVDEASAVKNVVIQGVEDRCNPDWFLIMGSPLDPVGSFYDIETKMAAHYTHHALDQLECSTEKGYWIDPKTIARKLAKWGRGHPLVQSNVFGQFGKLVLNALISLGEFDGCLNNPPEQRGGERHAFIDFAAGRAKNVFAVRVGNRTWIEKKWTETDTMAAVGEIAATFHKLHREIGLEDFEVEGDADGLGKPMLDRLREIGLNFQSFHGNGPPRYNKEYANAISEAWGEGTGQIKLKNHLIPDDGDFKGQVLSRKIKRNSTGKFQLESKEDMAARGLESPDEADGTLCAMMPTPAAKSVNLAGMGGGSEKRGWIEQATSEGGGGSDVFSPFGGEYGT